MTGVLVVLAVALMVGFMWMIAVYIPRRERERAAAWLDAVDDPATGRVQTYRRTETRRRDSEQERVRQEGVRAELRAPWHDLTVEVASAPQRMPQGATPVRVDDPHQVAPMWLWVSDPTSRERLSDLAFSRRLRAFLMETEGRRSIVHGVVQIERTEQRSDALGLLALQSEVASVLTALDQSGTER